MSAFDWAALLPVVMVVAVVGGAYILLRQDMDEVAAKKRKANKR